MLNFIPRADSHVLIAELSSAKNANNLRITLEGLVSNSK